MKGDAYDPGGVVVRCKLCLYEQRLAFDEVPFMRWPPICPHCAGYQPMLAARVERRKRVEVTA